MLIFDSFPDKSHALSFAVCVRDTFARNSRVFDSQDESDQYDPFPFQLHPPIVIVERDLHGGPNLERHIEQLVENFHGRFAGT